MERKCRTWRCRKDGIGMSRRKELWCVPIPPPLSFVLCLTPLTVRSYGRRFLGNLEILSCCIWASLSCGSEACGPEDRRHRLTEKYYSSANGSGVPSCCFFAGNHAGGPTLVGGLPISAAISFLTCLHHVSTAFSKSSHTSGLLL